MNIGTPKQQRAMDTFNFDDAMPIQHIQQEGRGDKGGAAAAAPGQTTQGTRQRRGLTMASYNPFALRGALHQPRPPFHHQLDEQAYAR